MKYARWVDSKIKALHDASLDSFKESAEFLCMSTLLSKEGDHPKKAWGVLSEAAGEYLQGLYQDHPAAKTHELFGTPDSFVYWLLVNAVAKAGGHYLLCNRLPRKQRDAQIEKAKKHLREAVKVLEGMGIRAAGRDVPEISTVYRLSKQYRGGNLFENPEELLGGGLVTTASLFQPEASDEVAELRRAIERLGESNLLADVVLPVVFAKLDSLQSVSTPGRVVGDALYLKKRITGCLIEHKCVDYFGMPYRSHVVVLVGALFDDQSYGEDNQKEAMQTIGACLS